MKRLVLDTNVLLSALISPHSPSRQLYELWLDRKIDVLTSLEQLDEIRAVTRYPRIRALLPPSLAGRLVNSLRDVATIVGPLPKVEHSPDPDDNFLLATAEVGRANYLVTGDKLLLGLKKYKSTAIVAPTNILRLLVQSR